MLLAVLFLGTACPQPKSGDDILLMATDAAPNDSGAGGNDASTPGEDASASNDAAADDTGVDAGSESPDATTTEDAGLPACNGGTCVPVANGFALGVMVDAADVCPAGFQEAETPIFAGLDPGVGCGGSCSCTANPTVCLGELFIYSSSAECMADSALTGGQQYTGTIDANCTTMPVQEGFPGGYRIGNWNIQQTCNGAGSAAPSPYAWNQQMKFCVATPGTEGCGSSSVCVGGMTNACVMASGGANCPAGFGTRFTDWYTGLSDTRSCAPCDCTASGGSCQFAQIALGSDWACTDDAYVSQSNPRSCGSAYSPPARVTGSPQDPTCNAFSTESGSIVPTGQQTICCQN